MIVKGNRVQVLDEGVSQGFAGALNFVGAGVSATVAGNQATVTIAGGGSLTLGTVEADVGATPVWRGSFVVVDAAIGPTSRIMITQAPGPYTGKGTLPDEAEMDPLQAWGAPGTGQMTVRWQTLLGTTPTIAPQMVGDAITGVATTSFELRRAYEARFITRRVGRVRGNIRFFYLIG